MRKLVVAIALLVPQLALANGTSHGTLPGSPRPYDFNHRDAATSASILERRRNCRCGSGSGGQVNYSYAIGNWSQINMTLESNANGMINSEEHQSNWGNETATMNIDSQNALGDQTLNNGGDWGGSIENQVVGNSSTAVSNGP